MTKENVILYARVSTTDQKDRGYSLRDQEQKLLHYCETNNLNVVKVYIEDYSAKSFNRPEFKKLLEQCKRDKKNISQLLLVKWDRFSRNIYASYDMLKTFDNLGIRVNAIDQPLDLAIPEQYFSLSIYLTMPDVENQRRSLNIKAGVRRASKEGRYVASAPKGYSMKRDKQNKPILKPNDASKYITEAFNLLASGIYNQKEVLAKLRKKGFKTSKSAFGRMIRNPIYCSKIHLKAFNEEPEMVIDGIHEPIITNQLFNKVQTIIDGRTRQLQVAHKKINEKFPLKGFILCPSCNNPLKASTSKGRSNYYSYYHCAKPCDTRYKMDDVHKWTENFFSSISLNRDTQKLLFKMIQMRFKQLTKDDALGPKHYEKVDTFKTKLIKIQDLYIDGDLVKKEYLEAKRRYQNILDELIEKETQLQKKSEVLKTYKSGLEKLQSIDKLYFESNIDLKRRLIGSMFPEKFQIENNHVRTADINPVILKIANVNRDFKRNKKRDKSKKIDLSRHVLKVEAEPFNITKHLKTKFNCKSRS